jgi:hypothetical protein
MYYYDLDRRGARSQSVSVLGLDLFDPSGSVDVARFETNYQLGPLTLFEISRSLAHCLGKMEPKPLFMG